MTHYRNLQHKLYLESFNNSNQMLFVDSCNYGGCIELDLSEAASKSGRVKFRGKFQEAEAINKNKRMYPYDVLDENIGRLQEAIADRRLIGELDHPTDSIVHFANASHIVTKLWWEGNVLMGEGEILSTPSGEILKALIHDNIKVGISSRGVGSGKVNEDGILVIGESYKLITFDVVADPSTFSAFQEKVVSNEAASLRSSLKNMKTNQKSVVKNESRSIANVNKDVLLAYVGSFIKSQTHHN